MKKNYKIYHQQLSPWYEPEAVFVSLFGKESYAFWLDGTGRFSYMGGVNGSLSKKITYTVSGHCLEIISKNGKEVLQQSIFDYLEEELGDPVQNDLPFDFVGGFVGYFGYELQSQYGVGAYCNTPLPFEFPDAYFFFVDRFLAFDHTEKKIYLVCLSENKKEAEEWFGEMDSKMKKETHPFVPSSGGDGSVLPEEITFTLSRNHDQYLQDIQKCQEYLQKGESYQICLTNEITADVQVDWLDLYLNLRKINPAPYSAYMRFGNFAVLSSSPEQFVKIDKQRTISSKPIKGTVKRGETREEDVQLSQHLGKTEKDFAENVMIVDLVRNDLGKVCKIGTVRVPKFLSVETYATVHQLVSTITGKLRDEVSVIDAIKSSFPTGSMTGAPKIRAMEIIAELEKKPRGVYSGALGFLSLNGAVDLSVVIRTIVATEKKLSMGVGGAILLQSDPESEYNEMLLKGKALMEAIQVCMQFS